MQNRLNDRRSQYKKTISDEPRRWREDVMTQIRKETRTEALNKRRMAATVPELVPGGPQNNDYKPTRLSKQQIQECVRLLREGNEEQRFFACEDLRKVLSIEDCPPINDVIEAGAVPLFMDIVRNPYDSKLQFEAAWCITNIASGSAAQTAVVIQEGAIPVFCNLLKSDVLELREQAVWAIGNLSGDNIQSRDMILAHGALNDMKNLMQAETNNFGNQARIPFLVNCTWTISNLLRGKPSPPFEVTNTAANLLHKVIYLNEPDIQSDACWAFSYMTDGSQPAGSLPDELLAQRINDILYLGCGFRLTEFLGSPHVHVQIPALRCVGNIVTGTDDQTQTMILCGAIPALGKLLSHANHTIQKEAAWAISNITAGNRAQIQEVISHGIIPMLLDRLVNGEFEVRKETAWALSNAMSGGNSQQVAQIVKYGAIKPLCDALQYHDERNTLVILDAIAAILKHGHQDALTHKLDENPYIPLLEQAGGFDRLEHLTGLSERSRLQQKAVEIIRTYLEEDEEEIDMGAGTDQGMWAFD